MGAGASTAGRQSRYRSPKTSLSNAASSGLLFGRPLAQVMHRGDLPKVVQDLQAFLQREDCITTEGIFRVPAPAHLLKKAQLEIDRGETPVCLQHRHDAEVELRDVHVAAGLYKLFFRRMPQPLIPWESYNAILDQKEPHEIVQVFQTQIQRWSPERCKSMETLLCFLATVAGHAKQNKMSRDNLATVFAPSVLRQRNASPMDDLNSIKDRVMRVKCLLRNYKSIFQNDLSIDAKIMLEL